MLSSCPSAHPPACLLRSGESYGFPPVILTYVLWELFLRTLHSHQNLSVTPEGRSPALSTCLALQRPHQVWGKAAEMLGSTQPAAWGLNRAPVPSTWPVTSPVSSPCCALSPFLHLPVLAQPLSPSLSAHTLNFVSAAAV